MREFFSRFRFGDFAAYFLPGLVMLCAIVWALHLTVFHATVEMALTGITFVEGLVLACVAYIIGAFLSGSSNRLFPTIYRLSRREEFQNMRCTVHPATLSKAVTKAFEEVFAGECEPNTWSEDKFYMIRSVINEKMPRASADAARQNDLMRLRENMVIPLLSLWTAALAFAFLKGLRDWPLGLTIAVIATITTYIAAGRLVGRASDNRAREVREVCTAFVVGAKLGLFVHGTAAVPESVVTAVVGEPQVLTREIGREILPIKGPTPGSA